ncbi:hypothetical protein GARC_4613 [Paraglaciecola arctica BSs20135]|uniref:Uncharacterized protein n=1 Tax=Paraglaciecola arctica BSs20135 TaxID=493475 RepID=K6ZDR2_9ALTE|nr:hypothetical protein GARC_4613 [Paraglaciecola arctica BSs20135]
MALAVDVYCLGLTNINGHSRLRGEIDLLLMNLNSQFILNPIKQL